MPTLQDAVRTLEEQFFVGRAREMEIFRTWLESVRPLPEILNVFGPSGVGKTSLLHAFRRVASERGLTVVSAGGRNFLPSRDGLLRTLVGPEAQDAITRLNDLRPLIMLDGFEQLVELTGYLEEEFLPSLDAGVKLVIAGRHSLHLMWSPGVPWHKLIRPLPLGPLSVEESHDYLARRGLGDKGAVRGILAAAGGHPLSLSLATDLVLQFGVVDLARAPEWNLLVHSLAEEFSGEVIEPKLRTLLQVCTVVRQFDEATLAAVSGETGIGRTFDQLCHLSVVRPSEHGLTLHEDVRRILEQDLRWRLPERYEELRLRALSHYRARARSALPGEREWLLAERFFLWENALIRDGFFAGGDLGDIWLSVGRPQDHGTILQIDDAFWEGQITAARESGRSGPSFDHGADRAWLSRLLQYPALRTRVARDRDGTDKGFSIAVPLSSESITLIMDSPVLKPVLQAYEAASSTAILGDAPGAPKTLFLLPPRYIGDHPDAVRAILIRDMFGLLAGGGVYLAISATSQEKALFETLGFTLLPSEDVSTDTPWQGFVLDLPRRGVETWMDVIMAGRHPARTLGAEELQRELRAVLIHWGDDAWLTASALSKMATTEPGVPEDTAQAVRDMVTSALDRAHSDADAGYDIAYHALRLAYLERGITHEGAAKRLAVSRSTFFRLLKRGLHRLATTLDEQLQGQPWGP
jgi:AAA ATPase domain